MSSGGAFVHSNRPFAVLSPHEFPEAKINFPLKTEGGWRAAVLGGESACSCRVQASSVRLDSSASDVFKAVACYKSLWPVSTLLLPLFVHAYLVLGNHMIFVTFSA